jgi:hypothetical protein
MSEYIHPTFCTVPTLIKVVVVQLLLKVVNRIIVVRLAVSRKQRVCGLSVHATVITAIIYE